MNGRNHDRLKSPLRWRTTEERNIMTGKEYRTITDVKGPLVFLNKTEPVAFGEIVTLRLSNGTIKNGQVLDTSDDLVIVQVFEGTSKIDREAGVTFMGDVFKLPVSTDLIGRILDGAGRPRDGGPEIVAEETADIIGAAINPYSRQSPNDFIQTGVSAIDLCTSLVRGQKLPIFSASGLPHNDIALQIARQAKLKDSDEDFIVVFCAMGITAEEYNFLPFRFGANWCTRKRCVVRQPCRRPSRRANHYTTSCFDRC